MEASKITVDAMAGEIVAVINSKYFYIEYIAADPTSACAVAERVCQKLDLTYGSILVSPEARALNPNSIPNVRAIETKRVKTLRREIASLKKKLAARGAA